jgi:polysaccharide export outer membrane protein
LSQEPVGTATPPAFEEYRINPGDELEIYVWGEERLQREAKVSPDGMISFPLAGQMVAQGLRPADFEALIRQRLASQYRGEVPQVTVAVTSPAGLQFTVLGKVNSPGTFTPGRFVNVLEALSMAGGPAQFADLDNILVLRKVGTGVQTYHLDVSRIFKGGGDLGEIELRSLVKIQTGDTIMVR